MDIAIQFIKEDLDDDKCFFKPITVVRGTYDKETNTFITESGIYCVSIDNCSIDDIDLFYKPTTIEELRKNNEGEKDIDILNNYFCECLEFCYIGLTAKDYSIELIPPLPIYEIATKLKELDTGINKSVTEEDESGITFEIGELKKLRDCKSIEDVRYIIDGLIDAYNELTEQERLEGKELIINNGEDIDIEEIEKNTMDLEKLVEEVTSKIISQDKAIDDVTTAIANNFTSKNPKNRVHILIAGPSGTGKTEMINVIAKYLGVPFFKADATAYTKEEYVGKSVYQMLAGLYYAANGDLEKAQNGILVIDEIDKKASDSKSDAGGQAVLNSLLKIMDRDRIEVDLDRNTSISFDTSNLTIICMGAFSDLFRNKKQNNTRALGFNSNKTSNNNKIEITSEDFIKYGMTSEFMGRISVITFTEELKKEDLIKILIKSKISQIKIKKEWFKDQNVDAVFFPSFYKEIAARSLNANTGARPLKNNIDTALRQAQKEVLKGKRKIKKLSFTKETVENPKKYYVE